MNQLEIFATALNLPEPWIVSEVQFSDEAAPVLTIQIDARPGSRHECSNCGDKCGVHDRVEKQWRHLNFWQFETYLVARVPRVCCQRCGVRLCTIPWARPRCGFTLLLEAMILTLCKVMPVSACAAIVGEHDTRLWRTITHYVKAAHKKKDWGNVTHIAVDETSRKKGHNYVTNFIDSETGALLFMTEGKGKETMEEFKSELAQHNGRAENIEEIAMDMSPAFRSGAKEHFPDAAVVFDRFHVMQMVGKAVDATRKEVAIFFGGLGKGSMWALRGNEENLNPTQKGIRQDLCRRYKVLARAMALRDYIQDLWLCGDAAEAEDHFASWYSWARRSLLPAFKNLAASLKTHLNGILAYFDNLTTSALIEAINGKLQEARRRAKGYRNIENFKAIAYWIAGDLVPELNLPEPFSIPKFTSHCS
jgi:transposase